MPGMLLSSTDTTSYPAMLSEAVMAAVPGRWSSTTGSRRPCSPSGGTGAEGPKPHHGEQSYCGWRVPTASGRRGHQQSLVESDWMRALRRACGHWLP